MAGSWTLRNIQPCECCHSVVVEQLHIGRIYRQKVTGTKVMVAVEMPRANCHAAQDHAVLFDHRFVPSSDQVHTIQFLKSQRVNQPGRDQHYGERNKCV